MIFIVVKFETRPEWTEHWPDLVSGFTKATRAEEGNLWFEWSQNTENPAEYVLVEAFRDSDAGSEHVGSEHFKKAMRELPKGAHCDTADHQPDDRRDRLVRDG